MAAVCVVVLVVASAVTMENSGNTALVVDSIVLVTTQNVESGNSVVVPAEHNVTMCSGGGFI